MRKRKKTSLIWTTSIKELTLIVQNNTSISGILKELNFEPSNSGGRFRTLKQRLQQDNIDYSHILLGSNSNKGRIFPKTEIPLKDIMIENSTYSRGHLKRRLLENNILENKCIICGQKNKWNNEKLVMVLDHINGIRNDNRLKNLRLLCPNCNSQQSTFAGRNNKNLRV